MADTLIKANPLLPSEDFVALRKQGFKEIEGVSSAIWTEYNNSDPGITILDAVCYAITDLGYRTGLDVKELLAPLRLRSGATISIVAIVFIASAKTRNPSA